MIKSLDRVAYLTLRDCLEDGLLDQAISWLPNHQFTEEIINDPKLRAAAIEGIKFHLIESPELGDLDTAVRLKEIFHIPNNELAEAAKRGVEAWVAEKGVEYGKKIMKDFGIPDEFIESEEVKIAKESSLYREGRRGSRIN